MNLTEFKNADIVAAAMGTRFKTAIDLCAPIRAGAPPGGVRDGGDLP